jgi:hypothetical protein
MIRLILAFLAFINYVKVKVVDDHMKPVHYCFLSSPDPGSASSHVTARTSQNSTRPHSLPVLYGFAPGVFNDASRMESESRALSGTYTEAELCRDYFLSYSVFLAFMLTMFLLALLIASEVYMERLLGKVLELEVGLQWEDEKNKEEEEALVLEEVLDTQQPECKHTDPTQSHNQPTCSLSTDVPATLSLRSPGSTSVSLAPVMEDYIPQPLPQGCGVDTRGGAMYRSIFGGKAPSLDRGGLVAGSGRRGCCLSACGSGNRNGSNSSTLLPPQNVLDELKRQQSDINTSDKSSTIVQYMLRLLPADHLNSRYDQNSTSSCRRWNTMFGRLCHVM